MQHQPRPIVLIILDGFGHRESSDANAIVAAKTPVLDKLWHDDPHTTLSASGLDVGLPSGQMGNSEVGHLTLGAGRVVLQDLTRINQAIADGSFYQNPIFIRALDRVANTPHALHILGLLSPGGVHSHEEQLHALIRLASKRGVQKIFVHAFLDGRDTPPQSAAASLEALDAVCRSLATPARIASLSGRYYAMDRDQRWERTKEVYELLTEGKAAWIFSSVKEALIAAYNRGETDEFVKPTLITPSAYIEDNDSVIFMNFRPDRARQLSYALTTPSETDFPYFPRTRIPKLEEFVTLTEYAKNLRASVAFPQTLLKNTLGEFLQNHKMRQLRIAETEKYAHVTYFFNGGRETPFENEDRILVPSLKVPTYDETPEMCAPAITEKLIQAIHEKRYDVIICNYANADMLGHTGNFNATVKAIEILDACLGKVLNALKAVGGAAFITADHGNAELMFDEKTKQPHTAHTLEEVPWIYSGLGDSKTAPVKPRGTLSDVAPTLIALLGLPQPPEMTGTPLIQSR